MRFLHKTHFVLLLIAALLCLKSTFAHSAPIHSTVNATDGNRKMVVLNGTITPLFWCEGITRAADLDEYAKAGFNTVVVRLYWSMSPNGSLVPQDLQPQRTFANAAAARGLYVIYALPEAPAGQIDQFTFSAANKAYFTMWENWTRGAMQALRDTPNLIGWMLPDDPRGLPYTGNTDFRGWLMQRYPSIQALNKEWMTRFDSFKSVSLGGISRIISGWRGVEPPTKAMTEAEFRNYAKRAATPRGGSPNWAFHPAELALGIYRWDAFRALVDRWAGIVHQEDPQHIVLSGQLTDYAELLALPGSVDISTPALWPGSAENDVATANPQAVDIARRAGRFCAMPVLASSLPEPFAANLPAVRLRAWGMEALTHGASGLALASWQDVKKSNELHDAVATLLPQLAQKLTSPRWQQLPAATAAVLLTPLADGFTFINETREPLDPIGTMGQWQTAPATRVNREERGLYGFCNQLVSGEPSDLVYALRWGTRFGSVDFISPDDLGGQYSLQQGGLLKKYATVLLPQAFWMPSNIVTELAQYTAGGGVIVADLGIGSAQTGGQANLLPPDLTALLGVIPQRMQIVSFNLHSAPDAGLLPSWRALAATPESVLTAGDGPGGAAFAGPTVFTQLLPGTKQLGLGFQLPYPLGSEKDSKRFLLQRAWLSASPQGSGLAIYAPFRLWTHWRPGYRGFDAFHQDLLGRGAALDTILNTSLLPSPSALPGAIQMFPEMVNYPDSIALTNHTPPAAGNENSLAGAQMAALTTGSRGHFLWRNAVCVFPGTDSVASLIPRPAPAGIPSDYKGMPSFTQLFSWVRADETKLLEQLPVRLQLADNTDAAAATVLDDTTTQFRAMLWPGANTVIPQNGQFRVPLRGGSVSLIINGHDKSGGYPVAPGSHHHLIITDWSKTQNPGEAPHQEEATIRANENGQLILNISGSSLQIQLTPENTVPAASGNKSAEAPAAP